MTGLSPEMQAECRRLAMEQLLRTALMVLSVIAPEGLAETLKHARLTGQDIRLGRTESDQAEALALIYAIKQEVLEEVLAPIDETTA